MTGLAELKTAQILVVDDNDANSELIREILADGGYANVRTSRDPADVPRLCRIDPVPDLLVLDLHMPGLSGFEVMAELRNVLLEPPYLPVLVVTADATSGTRRRALSLGAHDFLTKPVDPVEVLLRARNLLRAHMTQRALNLLVADRTKELELARMETLQCLGLAAEYRDDETNRHTHRVGVTAAAIAVALGIGSEEVQTLSQAAPLHDVGKLGLGDAILLKPGELTAEEVRVMRTHVSIGASILSQGTSPVLAAAAEIARFHHERWDGNGYLRGLAGDQIPLYARITAVADVFDALTHARPYKDAWPVDRAVSEILEQRGAAFDPDVVDAFAGLDHEELAVGAVQLGDQTAALVGADRLALEA